MCDRPPTPVAGRKSACPATDGVDAEFVRLVSSDGHEYIIRKKFVSVSSTINAMMSGPGTFTENEKNEISFREIPSHVLSRICHYFMYKVFYSTIPGEVPDFPIPAEISLELLMAANFLDC